ncbi:uncharacterized protein O9250_012684 [Rhynochetos jubatus]
MPRPPYLSRGLERRAWDKLPSFAAPCSRRAAGLARMGIAHPPCTPTSSSTSRSMHRAVATHPEATEDVDYKTNASLKPPYSYAELICMAMEASNQPKIPPSAIYKWITDNFCYFRHANATWQNSVRHNLSFNKCFVKVPREKDEPGKGGFWKLDPQHAERLKKDAFRKRRVSLQIHPALTRRVRQAAQGVAGPAAVVCTVESMLSVDKESQKLLEEFEAMTGEHQWSPAGGKAGQKRKLPSPKRMAKASRLSNLALATEEQALPAEEKALRTEEQALGLERRAWDKLPSFAAPCSRRAAGLARMGIAHPPCTPTSSSTSRSMHRAVATHPEATEDVDYKTNASLKPPYSYAELICMAMEASNQPKIPPSAIYKWITDNFCYFRHANATWQNSVRHNLSFNKCFVKVPREKDEPGKGGFWKLDPQHAERLKKDAFRKRRVSLQIHPALTRRVRQAAQGVAGPAAVVCTVESMLSVDKESQKLLEEFEAMTGEHQWSPAGGKAGQKRKLPSPKRMAKASRLSNLALATEEQALPAEEKALRTEEQALGLERRAWDKLPSFAAPCSRRAAGLARMGIAHPPCTPTSSSTSRSMHRAVATHPEATEDVDYKTNASLKPPYSYAELICMAMEASNQPKIPPSAIYKWITDNFCYFRHANATWQNSVRHNLSFNKCFVKVPREKDEPGKGGFWKLDPQHAERLKKDAFRKRRVSLQIHPALTRRVRQAAQGVAGPAAVVCTVESMLSVDKESQKLLEEFEAMTGEHQWSPAGGKAGQKRKLPSPKRMAKASRLSNLALPTQEEEDDLMSLQGAFDWDSILNASLDIDLSVFEDVKFTPPGSPVPRNPDLTVRGHQVDAVQGQEQGQVLTESSQTDLGLGGSPEGRFFPGAPL